jgi:MOSC domain-containing protein YiiM
MLVVLDAAEVMPRDLLRGDLARADRCSDPPRRPCRQLIHPPLHDTAAMHVSSVNRASGPSKLRVGSRMTSTGIDKRPAGRPVAVGPLGLDGDTIWSKQHHGGPDQAVYVYGGDDYAWWASELGRTLEPGTFGENVTVAGLATGASTVGDRLRVGADVVLEVTCGRIPCGTLTARMGIRAFTRRFREAARPGLYCRVIEPGAVQAGDDVCYVQGADGAIGVVELAEMSYARDPSREQLERALAAPISERDRRGLEAQLAALRSP